MSNLHVALAYYAAMGSKDRSGMERCLHPEVQFNGPMAKLNGKEAVLEGAVRFAAFLKSLSTRAQFASGDQVVLINDIDFPDPVGLLPTAVLMRFQDMLIVSFELFFDARRFG